jgi:hypothetical protein
MPEARHGENVAPKNPRGHPSPGSASFNRRGACLLHLKVGRRVPLDPGEHNPAEVGFEQTVRLRDGIVKFGAFLEFISIHIWLVEQLGGSLGALAPDGIQFENESGRAANWEFNVSSRRILHALIVARSQRMCYSVLD